MRWKRRAGGETRVFQHCLQSLQSCPVSWKRQKKSSLGKASSFSSKGWWARTQVVRGLQEALGRVVGMGEHDDVYATVGGNEWISTPRRLLVASLLTVLCACTLGSVVGPSCNAQCCWPVCTRGCRCVNLARRQGKEQ